MSCPEAIKDGLLNLKNRNWAFKNVGYGPANPALANKDFWQERAKLLNTTVDNAKTMRCGNCAAFIVTPEMLECIEESLGLDEDYDADSQDAQNKNRASTLDASQLGYCQLFGFKCAASRSCAAWLVGGPISKEQTQKQKSFVSMARLEYDK